MSNKQLLPVGFYDLLFDEAEKNHRNINAVLDEFLSQGYRLIKTSLVEFEESFARGEVKNAFHAVDVISGKNLVFRNDITLQIARLLDSRLKQQELPLKLCYVGDVLYSESENFYAGRQQTQVGLEIIGCQDEKSDFEIIAGLLKALKKISAQKLLIEFSLPNFLQLFLSELKFAKADDLSEAIRQKNISAIREMAGGHVEIIKEIALSNFDIDQLAQKILAQVASDKIAKELSKAQKIAEFLQKNFAEVDIRFDLFGDHKSSYHQGVAFDVFCEDFSYPVARGGRYKIGEVDAVGATIYLNLLRRSFK